MRFWVWFISPLHYLWENFRLGPQSVIVRFGHTWRVHPSLGQRHITQGWEAFFPDVGLSKFVRVGCRSILAHLEVNNTWLGAETKVLPQKGAFWGLRSNLHLPTRPMRSYVTECHQANTPSLDLILPHLSAPLGAHLIGAPFLRPKAYKVRVGGISPWCRIKQIPAGGMKVDHCPS